MYIVAFAHQLYTKYHIDGALQTKNETADSMGKVNIEGRNEMKFCDRLLDEIVNHRGSIKESGKCGQSGPCNVTQCVCVYGGGWGWGRSSLVAVLLI